MSLVPDALQNSRKILNVVDHYRDLREEKQSINKVEETTSLPLPK